MRSWTQDLLARLRLYYPDEVDNFLEEQRAPDEVKLAVKTREPVETVGVMIGARSWFFLRDGVILGPSNLRGLFGRVLASTSDYRDAKAWLNYVVREVVNLVYGGEALRLLATDS